MNQNNLPTSAVLSTDAIREILNNRIDLQKQAVGMVVGIVEPRGRRICAYGKVASGDARTVDGDTIFEIGSITKIFTSLLLADMVQRQEVALEDPASKYLPAGVKMPERSGKAITLVDLSTHYSGFPKIPSNMKPKDPRNPYADYTASDLYEFLSSYALPRDPGSAFEYSNLGGGLLGHLLALRSGTEYDSLIRSRIAGPLGMMDTGISFARPVNDRMATGHTGMLAPTANWDFAVLAGAGGLRSSVNDMLTLLEAFLGYKESPLTPAMQAMFAIRRPAGLPNTEIGLAWHFLKNGACHDGGTGGFRSFVVCDRAARIGVVVLSNAATRIGVVDIGSHILNPEVPLAEIEPPKQRTEISIDPKLLDNYTGRFQVAPDVILEITRDGDRLFAQVVAQGKGLPKFEIFSESEKKFFAKVADNQITFETAADNRATSLILRLAGRDMPAVRLS